MAANEEGLQHELSYYTLEHARTDPAFIHQYIVDAYGAQTADRTTKPIRVVFSLLGLYLHLEKGYTGKQVQLAHMALARKPHSWPHLALPIERGAIRAGDVLAAPPGAARDQMIERWMAAVWAAWRESQDAIRDLARVELGV